MKHIGWCLERIQVEMAQMPRSVISKKEKAKAHEILDSVQEYANTLAQLITHPKFKAYLSQLENSPIEGIQLQAHEIEKLHKSLEHLLLELDLYLKSLREILEKNPTELSKKADQLVLMIHQKFGGERGKLRKVFQVALHTKEELKGLVQSEKHLAAFLK